MTDQQIRRQIEAIKESTQNALKSKEAAKKFLTDAGILRNDGNKISQDKNGK